jgi:hypothetical protein
LEEEFLILRLICPSCNKDSYSASAEIFKPCPYCGILFSGKYGVEKRKEYRIQKEFPVTLFCKHQNLEAKTMNFSEKGLCLKLSGSPSLPVGDVLDLNIHNSKIKAQLVWMTTNKPNVSIAMAGLKIIEGDHLRIFES